MIDSLFLDLIQTLLITVSILHWNTLSTQRIIPVGSHCSIWKAKPHHHPLSSGESVTERYFRPRILLWQSDSYSRYFSIAP